MSSLFKTLLDRPAARPLSGGWGWLAACGLWLAMLGTGLDVAGGAPGPMSLNAPLYFEANRGQAPEGTQFLARGQRQSFLISPAETLITLIKVTRPASPMQARTPAMHGMVSEARSVRMQFVGGNAQAAVNGLNEREGKINYLIGNDASQWHTSVPTYSRVRVDGLYPGIDLVYYGNERQFEYDFTVHPEVDPSKIAIHFDGADQVSIGAQGDLILKLGDSEIHQHRPILYQNIRGVRKEVAGSYRLRDAQTVELAIGGYDHTQALVIDPILTYSSFFSGPGAGDAAWAVAVDGGGNIYMGGNALSQRFVTNAPGYALTNAGGSFDGDGYVAKFDPTGTNLIYFTYLGGNADDGVQGLAIDGSGNAYVTGYTVSTDFPVKSLLLNNHNGTTSYTNLNSNFDYSFQFFPADAFVAKIGPQGTNLIYSILLGGNDDDVGIAIALDPATDVFVTGYTLSTNFPVSTNSGEIAPYSSTSSDSNDVFVTKISADGTTIPYSTYLGGTNDDRGEGIGADAAGNAYVTGFTFSTNFPSTLNVLTNWYGANVQRTLNNLSNSVDSIYSDAFVAKINPTVPGPGSLVYCALLGGTYNDAGYSLIVDPSGIATVAGYTESFDFPNTATNDILTNLLASVGVTNSLNSDAFLARISRDGSTLLFSTPFGGTGDDTAWGVATDPAGDFFVVGNTTSVNFPTNNANGYLRSYLNGGNNNIFVTAFNPALTQLLYSVYMGGSGGDIAYSVAADSSGSAYLVGQTFSGDFPTTNALQSTFSGQADSFLSKIELPPPLMLSIQGGANGVTLSWPLSQPEYYYYDLQMNTNLTLPADWTAVPQAPVLTNGSNVVSLGVTNDALFFRLIGP